MPKIKTRKSVAKRVTGSGKGKIITRHASTGHLKFRKSESSKRRLAIAGQVTGGDRKAIKRAVPYLDK
jgi:large subunit ribosomal protein L35